MMTISKTLSEVKNYIDGKFERNGQNSMDVLSPSDGSKISSIPLSTKQDVDAAVQAAKRAFPEWSGMTFKERVQIFFRYRNLLEQNMDELTKLVQLENGKTYGASPAFRWQFRCRNQFLLASIPKMPLRYRQTRTPEFTL